MNTSYGFGKKVDYDFERAVERVTAELANEGFGILSQIDVAATMKKKLDKDMPPYLILGACNPHLANKALGAEPSIGLLLPCNVVVRQDEAGVSVEFLDPNTMQKLIDSSEVGEVAEEAREKLQRVLEAL